MCDEEQNDQDGMIEYPETRQFLSPPMDLEEAQKYGMKMTVETTYEGRPVVGTRVYFLIEVDLGSKGGA